MPTPRNARRASPAFLPPYPMGWLDRFIEWVERLPGPAWLLYLVAGALSAALFVAVQWSQGVRPSSAMTPFLVFVAAQPAIQIGTAHAVRASSKQSLVRFRPLLPDRPNAYAEAEYRVMNAPALGTLLASALMVLVVPTFMLGAVLPNFGQRLQSLGLSAQPPAQLVTGVYGAVQAACIGGLAFHVIHQLRTIARLVGQVPTVDLYRLEPVYAFSSTTAMAAVLLTVNNYLWYLTRPALLHDPFSIAMGIVAGGLALVAFAWPLWGAHRLLTKERQQALAENGAAFKTLAQGLHRQVQGGRLSDTDRVHKAMASLDLERAALTRIPTWPWHPDTLRTILAAVFLPIVVWLLQTFLGRALGA